jgi:hypothetical protein
VIDKTLDNQETRDWEKEHHRDDERYLHEPIGVMNVSEWKLVAKEIAHDAPLYWDYNDGLVMSAYTSPVDNRPYHKVCTYALTSQDYRLFDDGIEWGFSVAEHKGKVLDGANGMEQNSYGAPNHVYDVGHIFETREMWHRSFGETVAPQLTDQCSGIRAQYWRNRLYRRSQQFISESYVFGTCHRTCDVVSTLLSTLGVQYAEASLGAGHVPGFRGGNRAHASLAPSPSSHNMTIDLAALGLRLEAAPKPQKPRGFAAAAMVVAVALIAGVAVLRRVALLKGNEDVTKAERTPLLG